MRVVFESATGIICRGYEGELTLSDGQACAVATFGEDKHHIRVAVARFGRADSFTKLGPLRGYPGDTDLLLEWRPDLDFDPDELQAVLIGGVTHYCAA